MQWNYSNAAKQGNLQSVNYNTFCSKYWLQFCRFAPAKHRQNAVTVDVIL